MRVDGGWRGSFRFIHTVRWLGASSGLSSGSTSRTQIHFDYLVISFSLF